MVHRVGEVGVVSGVLEVLLEHRPYGPFIHTDRLSKAAASGGPMRIEDRELEAGGLN